MVTRVSCVAGTRLSPDWKNRGSFDKYESNPHKRVLVRVLLEHREMFRLSDLPVEMRQTVNNEPCETILQSRLAGEKGRQRSVLFVAQVDSTQRRRLPHPAHKTKREFFCLVYPCSHAVRSVRGPFRVKTPVN